MMCQLSVSKTECELKKHAECIKSITNNIAELKYRVDVLEQQPFYLNLPNLLFCIWRIQ